MDLLGMKEINGVWGVVSRRVRMEDMLNVELELGSGSKIARNGGDQWRFFAGELEDSGAQETRILGDQSI